MAIGPAGALVAGGTRVIQISLLSVAELIRNSHGTFACGSLNGFES